MLARVLLGLSMIAVGALILALLFADALPENQKETSFWLEHVQAWSTLVAALVAAFGLTGVFFALRQGRALQRIQTGPYVRIDVGPKEGTEDFKPPIPRYSRVGAVKDLAPEAPDDGKVSFWAWASNYQPHRLGFALAVAPFFWMAVWKRGLSSENSEPEIEFVDWEIPYLEYDKPVEIELVRMPREWDARLWVQQLSFYDFYDQRHEHSYGLSTNALHGRLTCEYRDGSFSCTPEARPRGPKVTFE